MPSLIEILNKIGTLENDRIETIAFRGSFIGVLSYSKPREDNSRNFVEFYRRKFEDTIFQEIHSLSEIEVLNETPLVFRDDFVGVNCLYKGSSAYRDAQKS